MSPPGFDPFHETQKGLADLLESEAAEAQQSYKAPSPEDWGSSGGAASSSRARLPPPGFHTAQPHQQQHLGTYLQVTEPCNKALLFMDNLTWTIMIFE